MRSLGYEFKRVTSALRRALEPTLLADCGVSESQFGVLRVVETFPGTSNADIARRLFATPQSVHQLVDRLEAAGFITRHQATETGRAREIHLTPRGRATLGWTLVPEVFRIARRTLRVVKVNIGFTAVYNLLGLSFAALGFLPPIFAAAAQSLPDLGILANSSRLLRQK